MLRSFAAVVAGFVLMYALSLGMSLAIVSWVHPIQPHGPGVFLVAPALTFVSNSLCAVLAGYVTGIIARRRPVLHAGIVALLAALPLTLLAAFYVFTMHRSIAMPELRTGAPLYLLFLLQPLVILAGGWLAERRSQPSAHMRK